MSKMTITKVKLLGDDTLQIWHEDDEKKTPGEKYKALVHEDFKKALLGMDIHLALITESIPPLDEIPKSNSQKVKLAGDFNSYMVAIIKNKTFDAIVITGKRDLESGKELDLETPETRLSKNVDKPESDYKHLDNLNDKLEKLFDEVKFYMNGDKVGTEPQLDMFEPPKVQGGFEALAPTSVEGVAAAIVSETNNGKAEKPAKTRRVKQTAEVPSGMAAEQ